MSEFQCECGREWLYAFHNIGCPDCRRKDGPHRLAIDIAEMRRQAEDAVDAIDLEKSDEEIWRRVDKVILSLQTLLMKADGTIN